MPKKPGAINEGHKNVQPRPVLCEWWCWVRFVFVELRFPFLNLQVLQHWSDDAVIIEDENFMQAM